MPLVYPKLLVATEFSPNAGGGGAAIARQMLKDWPVEKLFWWSCHPDADQVFGQRVAGHAVAAIPRKLYPHRRGLRQKSWLLQYFWSPWAARHFQKAVRSFQPDAVWVILHKWAIPPIAAALPATNVGFHVSIHDYPDDRETVIALGEDFGRKLAALTDQLYAAAATRDAISQFMVADLLARTGAAGTVCHAGLEPEDFQTLSGPPGKKAPDQIRIAYAGTVSRESTFSLFVQALGAIRPHLPKPVFLELFSAHSYGDRPWFDASWIRMRGNLPEPQLKLALRQCHWGFVPMSLAEDDPRHRLALPTKLVSCLAAGLPVVTLGHPDSSAVKIAAAYGVGLCSTETNAETLAAQLVKALAEPEPGFKFRPAIQQCAANEFDAQRMRAALHENFRTCAAA